MTQPVYDENLAVGSQMPRYVSHKEVWALKIADITRFNEKVWLHPAEPGYGPFVVGQYYIDKHMPTLCVTLGDKSKYIGGYFVIYKDGYQSWSPAKAFEEGYKPL